ncbi:MAG: hypothetical protein KGL57_04870 [Burkholderiales bacterium]|nr:hypothetical protein [Burkholderiales bacterium]
MSHDQGRPSLFAGMEDGATPGSDTQRVRILSTLESTRRAQRPARKGPPSKGQAHPGATRAWAITLGLGGVTLLISFVLIVQSQRPALAKHEPLAQAAPAVAPVAPAAPTPPVETPSAPQAESPAMAANEPLESLPPTAASSAPQDAGRDPLAALNAAPADPAASAAKVAEAQPSARKEPATTATTAATAKSTKPAAKPASTPKAKGRRSDQDVELIEAVMNHASSRPGSR